MLDASDLFKATLRTSHTRVVRVHLYGKVIGGDDTDYGELEIVNGTLNMDIGQFVSTTMRATIALDPFGTLSRRTEQELAIENGYLTVEVGLRYPHDPDHPEFIKIATLRLTRFTPSASLATTTIEATDRTIMLRDFPITDLEVDAGGYQGALDAGWDWTDAVQALTVAAMVGEVVDVDAGVVHGNVDPTTALINGSRDQLISQWADAHGAYLRVTPEGWFHLTPKPVTGDPVWAIQHGVNGVLVENNEEYSRDLIYNAVWVQFQQPDKPPPDNYLSAIEMDLDSSSRTYWNGPFGRRVKVIDDVPVTTDAEAHAVALQHLGEILGRYFSIQITALTNPLLQLGDTISVEAMDLPPHLRTIESISLPLGPEATMSITTRTATS